MKGYYVVMCGTEEGSEEYSGIRWHLDQERDAVIELREALDDPEIDCAWIKEVISYD